MENFVPYLTAINEAELIQKICQELVRRREHKLLLEFEGEYAPFFFHRLGELKVLYATPDEWIIVRIHLDSGRFNATIDEKAQLEKPYYAVLYD